MKFFPVFVNAFMKNVYKVCIALYCNVLKCFYLSVSARGVIGQFCGPHSQPAKFENFSFPAPSINLIDRRNILLTSFSRSSL